MAPTEDIVSVIASEASGSRLGILVVSTPMQAAQVSPESSPVCGAVVCPWLYAQLYALRIHRSEDEL
jgi:hypothetical protein